MTPTDLKAWRAKLALTQDAAAEKLGMSASNYKDLESGKRRSSGKIIEVIDKRTQLACDSIAKNKE